MTDNRGFVRSILPIGLVLLGLIPAVANAQQATTVSGQVKTSVGGTPLYGAIVSVPSLRVSAATDPQGRYQLAIPAGTSGAVTLSGQLIGFKTQSVQISLTGGSVQQDIALGEGPIELEAKVVTALGIERELRRLTYAAQSGSGDQLAAVPTQNVV